MPKRMTIVEFKEKASKKFNGKFNYDNVDFIHSREPVEITCPEHGIFFQIPFLHLKSKYGCPYCSGVGKKTTESFIIEARKVHGELYTYDKAIYKGNKEELLITCPVHGDFAKTPIAHVLRKEKCPKCNGKVIDTNTFITKSQKIHGFKYSYDKVIYKSFRSKVELICNTPGHGSFFVSPFMHLKNKSPQGCPSCSRDLKSMTTEEFIEKAKIIHRDKYKYDKTIYSRSNQKVIISCSIHGEFEQQANSHLQGTGCPKCGTIKNHKSSRKSRDQFIKAAIKKHGDKYSYDKVEYVNTHTKVIISCKVKGHGEFFQEPNSHLRGSGCPICYGTNKLSNIEFVKRANIKHNNKYDYSITVYESTHNKVIIICKTHGEFKQSPASHLLGSGCPNCLLRPKMTKEYFLQKAKEKHGEKYDYSKVKFSSISKSVIIICPIHGPYEQKPKNHLRSGCPYCGGSYKLNTEVFIEKANLIHDQLYSYANSVYINSSTKIEIICPYHGRFLQLPSSHLQGHGCKNCRNSRGEFRIEKYLKQFKIKYESQFSFADCRNTYPLSFDFAIFNNGKMALIEYNGEQHYTPINFGSKGDRKPDLELIKKNDSIKKDYCEKNKLQLLIIKYTDFNQIEEIVYEYIKEIKLSPTILSISS